MWWQNRAAQDAVYQQLEAGQLRLAKSTADAVALHLAEYRAFIERWGQSLNKSDVQNPERLQAHLESLPLISDNAFTTLSILDLQGHNVAWVPVESMPPRSASFADREYFRKVLATKSSTIEGPLVSRALRTPVTLFSAPIFGANQEVVGVALGAIENAKVVLSAGLNRPKVGDGSDITVVSGDGIIVAHSRPDFIGEPVRVLGRMASLFEASRSAEPRVIRGVDEQGNPSILAIAPISGTDPQWSLVVEAPVATLLAPTQNRLNGGLYLALIGTVVLAAILWITIRIGVAPIRALGARAKELSKDPSNFKLELSPAASREEQGIFDAFTRLVRSQSAEVSGLTAESALLHAALHSISEGVLALDPNGTMLSMNSTASRLLGWREADALGRPLDHIYLPRVAGTDEPSPCPLQPLLIAKNPISRIGRLEIQSRDGRIRPIDERSFPVHSPNGELAGVVILLTDATRRRADLLSVSGESRDLETGLLPTAAIKSKLIPLFDATSPEVPEHSLVTVDLSAYGVDERSLRIAGQTCRDILRPGDCGFRWTQHCLLLLLCNCDLSEAAFISDDLYSKLQNRLETSLGREAAVGVLVFTRNFAGPIPLLEAAQQLIVQARQEPEGAYISPTSAGSGIFDSVSDLLAPQHGQA